MKKRKFFALVAVACLAMVMLFKAGTSFAQLIDFKPIDIGEVIEKTDKALDDNGIIYCRCKKDSSGVKGCYAGNHFSVRPNCAKIPGSSTTERCPDFHNNCPN